MASSIDRGTRDATSSCSYCQFYKIGTQRVHPLTLTTKTRYPFDLLQFPRSSIGNIAVLLVVDYFSKFVIAVPIGEETSQTVGKALSSQVYPHLAVRFFLI